MNTKDRLFSVYVLHSPFWMLNVAMATHAKIFDSWLKHAMRETRERAGIQSGSYHTIPLSLMAAGRQPLKQKHVADIDAVDVDCGRGRGAGAQDIGAETEEKAVFQ